MDDQSQPSISTTNNQVDDSQLPALSDLGTPPVEDNLMPQPLASDNSSQTSGLDNQPADASPLSDIKSQALNQLTPLVQHLDQSPEEHFKTILMLIQASDNQGLVKDAYEAAQQITDEKAKAQALLDIVNEINYFTQQKNS